MTVALGSRCALGNQSTFARPFESPSISMATWRRLPLKILGSIRCAMSAGGVIPIVLLQILAVALVYIWPPLVLWLPAYG
jgi:TRAP-type mannitol/chloroaromatic compound transport system permease large subunit